jgi:hypothetical protein
MPDDVQNAVGIDRKVLTVSCVGVVAAPCLPSRPGRLVSVTSGVLAFGRYSQSYVETGGADAIEVHGARLACSNNDD